MSKEPFLELPLEDGTSEELIDRIEKEKEENIEAANEVLNNAKEIIDDINTDNTIEVKKLKEKLILSDAYEDFDDREVKATIVLKTPAKWNINEIQNKLKNAIDYLGTMWVDKIDVVDTWREQANMKTRPVEITDKDYYNKKAVLESMKKKLTESAKIYIDISDYTPWSGAVSTWDEINDADKVEELDELLEELYPDGLSETELNDLLWHDSDYVLDLLGIKEEDSDED